MKTGSNTPRKVLSHQEIQNASIQYGTPLYLYNFDKIRDQFLHLKNNLPDNFYTHYTLKANSSLAVCSHLAQLGSKVDICSEGELSMALKAGFSPGQIVFTGPGKEDRELNAALEAGCALIVLESLNEASRLNDLAQKHGVRQSVLLRINPMYRTQNSCEIKESSANSKDGKSNEFRTSFCKLEASKFGVDEDQAEEAMAVIAKMENLKIKGIHIFTESNVLDYTELMLSWQNTIRIANALRDKGYSIDTVDFGGGIGVPYHDTEPLFDIESFGEQLQKISDQNTYHYEYILEMGRYILAEAGMYITEVIDIKDSYDATFVIVNGGSHHLCRSTYLREMNSYMDVIGKKTVAGKKVKLVGKLPTPTDIMVDEIMIPEDIAIGDQIVIYNCGAYGFNFSRANFLLHQYPAEAAYENGELSLIRIRGNVSDFLINQCTLVKEKSPC